MHWADLLILCCFHFFWVFVRFPIIAIIRDCRASNACMENNVETHCVCVCVCVRQTSQTHSHEAFTIFIHGVLTAAVQSVETETEERAIIRFGKNQ